MDAQSSRLQLKLEAKNLANLSAGLFRGRSDPFCVVAVRGDSRDNVPIIVGQTEVVFDTLDPDWSTIVFLDGYRFGSPFLVEVGVFDYNARSMGMNESVLAKQATTDGVLLTSSEETREQLRTGELPHAVMGTALFEIGAVMASRGNMASKALQSGGKIIVRLERSTATGGLGQLNFQLEGVRLASKGLGKSNHFFQLQRSVDHANNVTAWTNVFRSNVVKSSLNPLWEETTLNLEGVCNSDLNRPMKIVVSNYRKGGKHRVVGEVETSMQQLIDTRSSTAIILHRNGRTAGHLNVVKAEVVGTAREEIIYDYLPEARVSHVPAPARTTPAPIVSLDSPEFVDYLSGGCRISLAVAIDFTASNGNPRQPGTPHYFSSRDPTNWNDYQKALFAVGSILARYDADQRFPVWGFGAKYDGVLRQCFQCGNQVQVDGVPGILDAYKGVFSSPLTMSYPTDFTEVIRTASAYAMSELEEARNDGKLSYTILLILTAGQVENAQQTKIELEEASDVPLSVVIVGIGDSDFADMEFLDDHDPSSRGRDITKFVPFKDYSSYNKLTEAVLDEIPSQLVEYYHARGVMPGRAESTDLEDVPVQEPDDDERTLMFLG